MKDTDVITTKKLIGHYLKSEREYQHLTPNKVATLAGLQKRQIKWVEEGSARYDIDVYLKVMAALDCSLVIINGRGSNSGLIQVGLDDALSSL